jgi:hypothetical protein
MTLLLLLLLLLLFSIEHPLLKNCCSYYYSHSQIVPATDPAAGPSESPLAMLPFAAVFLISVVFCMREFCTILSVCKRFLYDSWCLHDCT